MPDSGRSQNIVAAKARRHLDQQHRDAVRLLGYFLFKQGHFSEASEVCAGLMALDPNDVQAWRTLIASLLGEGRNEDALVQAEAYLESQGQKVPATLHLLKAQALWRLGRQDEARAAVQQFQRLRQVS